MMDIIEDKLKIFISESSKVINKLINNGRDTETILLKMKDANLALLTIKLGKIHCDVLRHIAPYFNLKIDDELLE